jgi:betaine lipid synthase
MAFLTPSILPKDPHTQIFIVGVSVILLIGIIFAYTLKSKKNDQTEPAAWESFMRFIYACFLKRHEGDSGAGQQAALESFYKAQANVYDVTRKTLLRGREDMLALVAAQLVQKAARDRSHDPRCIWVDVSLKPILPPQILIIFCGKVGGGTGYNIEAMSAHLSVPDFFSSVYLVDFSPSLCEVARKRFARLGWDNVKVVCQDARLFRLEDHEDITNESVGFSRSSIGHYSPADSSKFGGADLITMSYSLSMIVSIYEFDLGFS